ncbi:hypothetical protein MRX96_029614 [Rhipicephalus microplus]
MSDPLCPTSDGDGHSEGSGESSVQQSKAALASVDEETDMSPKTDRMKRSPEEATEAPASTHRPPRLLFVRLWRRWPFRRVLVIPVKVANYTLIQMGK